MRTLIVYDTEGHVVYQASGDVREPVGIPFIWVEVPEGKRITGVDVAVKPNVAILEDLPKTESQLLQEQIDNLNIAMAEIMGV
ncbi:hypothetical protein KQI61_04275 [Anaerocolumna aminovalerica]|uniref:hypothetical protein n=1 Tax=Anaerocolumna aminovalerica TaxID=1527 RepID=UPI001C0F0B2E|nr:hypothetical protein [Anaerocolumna aminovalerica]MBU5331404.1 hypothetical protein [Anaerocolumna aminovalerica]